MSRITHLLVLSLAVLALAAVWGFQTPTSAAPTANPILVTITDDGLNEDGKCALREALHNANTNTQFSMMDDECPAGSDSDTDVIVLVSGAEYILNIAGPGDDAGDLDVLSNGLPLDLRLEVGEGTPATIRVNMGLNERVVEIHGATVEIENITLTRGSTADNGGGILNNGGTLILTKVALQNNAANAGGGLYNVNGTVTISNSQIILNTGALGGGGLFNSGPEATLTLQATIVRLNESTGGSGGGLGNSEGTVLVQTNSSLSLNTAEINGGGLSSSAGGRITLQNALVESNTATSARGGGLYIADATSQLVVENSIIAKNEASQADTGYGGGVMVENGATAVISDSDISENDAYIGGGIFNDQAEITLSTSNVFTNTALAGGGLVNKNGSAQVTAVTLQGNEGGEAGGGIYTTNGSLQITDSQFIHNTALGIGGGIVNGGGVVTVTNTLFQNNQASSAGGIGTLGGPSKVTLNNSTFSGNIALTQYGGAIANEDGQVIIQNGTTFVGNGAQQRGGAIFNIDGHVTLHNATLENNTSNADGGGIYNTGATAEITAEQVQFLGNTADFGIGGAFYTTESGAADILASNFHGNAALTGGAMFASATSGTTTLTQVGIYTNTAIIGSGIWAGSVLALNNSTISGNTADSGALYVAGVGSVTAIHTTLANNTPGFDVMTEPDATLTLQNSIIATAEVDNCFIMGSNIFSMGGNLSDDASCGGLNDPSDQVSVDPLLATLADNGGDTLTHALLEGSPAVDSAVVAGCTAEPINGLDQRGFGRGASACDSGAFEFGGTLAVYLPLVLR